MMFVPTPETAARIVEEFAEQDLTLDDLMNQVITRMEIVEAVVGKRPRTPRRVVRAIFDITSARRRSGLRPYPDTVRNAVVYLLADA